jgi:hypothetical protein
VADWSLYRPILFHIEGGEHLGWLQRVQSSLAPATLNIRLTEGLLVRWLKEAEEVTLRNLG